MQIMIVLATSSPESLSALTELIINSITQYYTEKLSKWVLMSRVKMTMQDALRDACDIQEGRISHLNSKQKSELAENSILIGVKRKQGFKKFPTITISDFGEDKI